MQSLTVIIATLERPDEVARLLPGVLAQAPTSAEVVVVDQSSPSARDAVARTIEATADPRVVHVHRSSPGLPAARNTGVDLSSGAIVLFLDDDVELVPGCIAAHLAAYRDPVVGGVVGRIDERRLRPNAWRTTNRVTRRGRVRTRLDGPDACEIETLKGANMSLRRSAIEAAGGFDPGFGGTALLEDADLSTRVRALGWVLRYEPDAAVIHHHHPHGGVRSDRPDAAWWRLHNAARYVRRHHGVVAGPELLAFFGALAVWESVKVRDLHRGLALLRALGRGWWATTGSSSGGGDP